MRLVFQRVDSLGLFNSGELSLRLSLGMGIPRLENRETWGTLLAERRATFMCSIGRRSFLERICE